MNPGNNLQALCLFNKFTLFQTKFWYPAKPVLEHWKIELMKFKHKLSFHCFIFFP